jgi:PKD repeat protein
MSVRIICILIVVGTIACFSTADIVRAESVDVAEYFPLESGLSWTYSDGLNTVIRTVLPGSENVNGIATKVVQQTGGEYSGTKTYYSSTANGIFEHKEFAPNVFIDNVGFCDMTATLNPPMKLVNRSAAIGDFVQSSGSVTYTISCLGSFPLNYTATTKIVQIENVTVPLYTFTAVKMQSSLTIYGYIYGQYFSDTVTSTDWLAQHIGLVKSISPPLTYELVSINFSPPPPVADFTASVTSGVAPLTVSFSDLSAGYVDQWQWDFGDSATSSVPNTNHSYSKPGAYSVSLTATGLGGTDTETKTYYIRVAHPGADLNQDLAVDLYDAVLALQVMVKKPPLTPIVNQTEISGLGRVDLAEAIYILQFVSGLR